MSAFAWEIWIFRIDCSRRSSESVFWLYFQDDYRGDYGNDYQNDYENDYKKSYSMIIEVIIKVITELIIELIIKMIIKKVNQWLCSNDNHTTRWLSKKSIIKKMIMFLSATHFDNQIIMIIGEYVIIARVNQCANEWLCDYILADSPTCSFVNNSKV